MRLVLDASVALSWSFERTDPKEYKCANEVLTTVADSETLVAYRNCQCSGIVL